MGKITIIDTAGTRSEIDTEYIRSVIVSVDYGTLRLDFQHHLRVTALKSSILIIPVASNVIDIGEANA